MERIIAHKRLELADLGPYPARRSAGRPLSLGDAIDQPGPRFIFEFKRAAPSAGILQKGMNPLTMAKAYRPFADAISVLTDRKFFKGSYQDLAAIKSAVQVPVLCKDFILDERQIDAAYNAGADAILLMLSVLCDRAYLRLSKHARALGLSVLTEAHDSDEMARALVLGARLIGINNRDLKTLDVSLETTRTLAPLAPDRVTLISESGIAGRDDISALSGLVDGFLIGSAPMRSDRPDLLVRNIAFGEVKICGLTRRRDSRAAYNAGATYGGVNFVAGTPRVTTPAAARQIIGNVPLKWVGVFRGVDVPFVARVARDLNLTAVQLHGRETPEYRQTLRDALPKTCEIWQAVVASGPASLVKPLFCDRIILDNSTGAKFGGTGKTFDWSLLKDSPDVKSFGLAGGINSENITTAMQLGAGLIDVCSGVEKSPGFKAQAKMKALFAAIRSDGGRERGMDRC